MLLENLHFQKLQDVHSDACLLLLLIPFSNKLLKTVEFTQEVDL